jgi:hypothetical protein
VAPEIILVGVIGLLIVVLGVPAIQRGIFLPREFTFERPADDALTDRQRAYFQRIDGAMSAIGYAPLLNSGSRTCRAVPLRFIDAGLKFVLAVWMAVVAARVAAWRMGRELLV